MGRMIYSLMNKLSSIEKLQNLVVGSTPITTLFPFINNLIFRIFLSSFEINDGAEKNSFRLKETNHPPLK